jgi:hypothetical protein
MITTKVDIRQHICEYAIGKFGENYENPIDIPDRYDLYHTLWDLLSPRPSDHQIDKGNLEIFIPCRKVQEYSGEKIGKNPERFNYLSARAAKIIDIKIETMLFAELHDLLDENKHRKGIEYQETVHIFVCKYQISSISEDALLKNYYRWRKKIKRMKDTRPYTKHN